MNHPSEYIIEEIVIAVEDVERLRGLVNDLLDLSKIESGKMPIRLEKLDLSEAIKSCLSRLSAELERRNLELVAEGMDNRLIIYFDPDHVRRYESIPHRRDGRGHLNRCAA